MNTKLSEIKTNYPWFAPKATIEEMCVWLVNNIGEINNDWYMSFVNEFITVKFRNEQDAVLFKMRWV